ncbi:sigma-70 family RNA polymerase sigma factor [candidate division KSB1 bacterium]|nr:sigma-70 family RNA polymerase sigma factor [candidate division KSB1 bacterium]
MEKDELAALVEEAKNLEPDALAKLCEYFYPKIYRYIFYRVHKPVEAEDLTGDVCVRAVEAIGKQKGSFTAWLYRIAANLIIDHYRRKAVRHEIALTEEALEIPNGRPERALEWPDELEKALTQEQVRKALQKLTDEQQQVIVLKFIEGYDNPEIAEMLGKSVGAIKGLQFRALSALKEIFQES